MSLKDWLESCATILEIFWDQYSQRLTCIMTAQNPQCHQPPDLELGKYRG
jgi:hypothetical protein